MLTSQVIKGNTIQIDIIPISKFNIEYCVQLVFSNVKTEHTRLGIYNSKTHKIIFDYVVFNDILTRKEFKFNSITLINMYQIKLSTLLTKFN